MLEIKRYVSGLLVSNMYLIVEGNHAIVIDPFGDASPAEGLTIDYILLTHEHYDHISGVNNWKKSTDATTLCSRTCAENIQNPRKSLACLFKEFCELQTWIKLEQIPESDSTYVCTADKTFEDRYNLEWQGHMFNLFEMPGHSAGSTGILLDETNFFSGDSLLENSDIELRLPGGSRKQWECVGKKRLEEIPSGTRILPGHFDSFILTDSK